MRVLVTGATGFLGSWVARELQGRGHEVRVLHRPASPLTNLEKFDVERVLGDVLDERSVRRALAGCEAVVHTAGAVHFQPTGLEELRAVNEGGVEVVLGAALAAGVSRAVVTSSMAVLGGRLRPEVLDEQSPSNAESLGIAYHLSKLRGEQAAMRLFARGLPVVAVRPAFVLGPGDVHRTSAGVVLAVARGDYPLHVEGGLSACDVRDVAAGHAEALMRGRPGEAYLLGGHNLHLGDFIAEVARVAGVRPPRRVPYAAAWPVALAAELSARLGGKRPRLTRQLLASARLYSWVRSDKAVRELGYRIRPLEESLRDTLLWFLERGMLSPGTQQLRGLLSGAPGKAKSIG